ncbi:alpha/beta hydrolase [Pseudoalteromonas sp. NSLLW218]|uniref:alpha/beta hydrolase n=1 Tax=Pseudoalteromonas sp. NSLLW218 TaxID=2792048 RepID=UPI0018CF2372|nr:alpha/beta hydrolase [Pseudoalteromonas sp. NSLLW218]MBH0090414.1 alpha/beta hydrolase [Pseudoalteromonas sp. NSLLW218]
MAAHHEVHLETYITKKLVENGWKEGTSNKYDKERALYTEDVAKWVKTSQPEAWEKLEKLNGARAETVLVDRVAKSLESKTLGTMKVLREGIQIAGAGKILLSQKAPEDNRNPKEVKKYNANILRVVRQLKYCPTREWEIDLVFFINGIPVATVELKTDFTQSIDDAVKQYKEDRLPVINGRAEPLLTFKRGAVVHFAMSDSEIKMTTRLSGESTFFLPFNKGNNGYAGNPTRDDGEYPVAYFWEEICKKDSWLRIFHSFVYIESSEKVDKHGVPKLKEVQIFPRYHQLRAVNKMIADAKVKGAGQQYLCEHSAGSGKTSTIAWTAHDLTRLRNEEGKAHFNSVIVVTDRTVLDAQLQDAIQQIDHQFGMIEAIDKKKTSKPKSKQLAEALLNGTPIIIVTIQTFPFAMESIITEKSLKDRNFAVIIDEAHTSQTGSTAQGLRAALSLDSKDNLDNMSIEDLLLEVQRSRVRPNNISHFAFTATPKHSTFTLFGRPEDENEPVSDTNKPQSFDKYTQRQAIEEGFILDVLENYTPYKTAFKLASTLELDDKRVDKKMARRSLARWQSLHPTNPSQKIEFIVKHFKENVMHLLNGEAKAMVVTSGRPQAVKYKMAFDAYLKKNNLQGIKALVAFSGKVKGTELGDDDGSYGIDEEAEYSEINMNPDIGNTDLRHAFEEPQYKVMLVASKFQTGFNQPKLVAMYLDKKISGVEAVQTLSRLNRTYPGKDTTYVIDFANEPETILQAFKDYDEGATLANVQDTNVVYDMQVILDNADIYNFQDLEKFKNVNVSLLKTTSSSEQVHRKLYSATQRPTDVFNSKLKILTQAINEWEAKYNAAHKANDEKAMKVFDTQRSEYTKQREGLMRFKSDLARFVKVYSYIAQLIELEDPNLENFANFGKLLSKRLNGVAQDQVDLTALVLKGYKISKLDQPDETKSGTLTGIKANEHDATDREKEFLSQIVVRMNNLFGDISDATGQQHFTSHIVNITKSDARVIDQVESNTKIQALHGDLPRTIRSATVEAMKSHGDLARILLKDSQNMEAFSSLVYDIIKHENTTTIDLQLNKSVDDNTSPIDFLQKEINFSEEVMLFDSAIEDEFLEDPRNIPVWFGTNRKLNENNGEVSFGSWDKVTTHGKCLVNIPEGHKPGSIGSAWWIRLFKGDDRLRVLSVKPIASEKYWDELKKSMEEENSNAEKEALFFLHGYNVSFNDAAIRTAQLSYDLKISPAIFFSWPSDAEISSYNADEATIEASYEAIIQFVKQLDIASIETGTTLHIMAHSMGNRAILKSLEKLSSDIKNGESTAIDKLVFAAPDVDTRVFMQSMDKIENIKSHKTLYISQRDKAVWLSKTIHKNHRAGLMPPVTVLDGIDTIDSTAVDDTFLGHSYVDSVRALLTDLSSLIKASLMPKDRVGLEKAETEDGEEYWRIR